MAAFVRFPSLGMRPLSGEERWTLVQATGFSFVDQPPTGMVVNTDQLSRWTDVRDVLHRIAAFDQPVFVLLSRFMLTALGPSEWSLRLLSAVAGTVSPLLLFAWSRRVVGDSTALLAAALLALHPFHVTLSRFGRVYAVAMACLLVGYLIPHHWRGRPVFSPIAVFLGFQPLTHMLSGFALIPHLVYLRFSAHVRKRQLLASIAVGLVILAGALPFGLADSIVSEHVYTGLAHRGQQGPIALSLPSLFATGAFSLSALFATDADSIGGRTRYVLPFVIVLALLAVRGLAGLKGAARVAFALGALLPTTVALILSFVYDHLLALLPRYSVWSVPFLMVLVALGLRSLPQWKILSAAVLSIYGFIDATARLNPRPGYTLAEAARIGSCSGSDMPLEVEDPLDAFVAGTAGGRGVYFRVAGDGAARALVLNDRGACRAADHPCEGVAVCGASPKKSIRAE